MRIGLSGTPGTGKTAVAKVLRERGHATFEVNDLAREKGLLGRLDRERSTREVDVDALDEALSTWQLPGRVILVGHLSHLLTVDLIVVLRCRPSILSERLMARGYEAKKVRENVEAEALDVILVEAVETGREVCEIDTSAIGAEAAADAMEDILAGEREKYAAGDIDWSEEVLGWF